MKLHFLGGAMEIGGSCIYFRIADKGILMDAGIRQSGAKDPLPDFLTIQKQGGLDAIIVSHAHMDHIGTLPIISKAYPNARIYMTSMTADLTRVLLYDSLKIMNYRENEIPHYSERDVLSMLGRIQTVGYQIPFPVFEGFTMTFYPAGHIAGASCIYLATEEGTIFYSGDFSAFSQRTIEGISIPKLRPDIAIVEATYGNRLHANRQVEEKRLVDLVKECILERKKILIPVFALGRAQEVLLIVRAAIQNGEIPGVPVYVDGMVRDINIMYTRNPVYLKNSLSKRILRGNEPFYTKEIQPVAATQKREELINTAEPAIFLSSSGMLTGGPSALYAKLLAASENACIIITGYQDEESPGRQLLNLLENTGERNLTLNGSTIPVNCRIEQVGLSAHGDKSEIMALVERLSARRIFLVHGNPDAMDELGKELSAEDFRRQIFLPECGQFYEFTLHDKRKQNSFRPGFTMGMQREYVQGDEKRLWDFWQEHYAGMRFAISQIAYIWYGREVSDTAILQEMQELLWNSCYFAPNTKRLFLLEANTPEKVASSLTPRELTQQELSTQIEIYFANCPYRKISYHGTRREVMLQFDYPDTQDAAEFRKRAAEFNAATGWTVKISPSMNHNAASLLLSLMFGARLLKTSYYTEKKCYVITLDSYRPEEDRKAAERFQSDTGWLLTVSGQQHNNVCESWGAETAGEGEGAGGSFFRPASDCVETAEQNMAFDCIDQVFAKLPHKPDKKSLKQDGDGKYMEISFVSPAIGHRYREHLQSLSDSIGWRIRIADKVNQNELSRTAQLLCMKYEIPLAKNPSYLPGRKTIQLKTAPPHCPEKHGRAREEFREITGCECVFVQ